MNSKILDHYHRLIEEDLKYLENSTIRTSLENYKINLEEETAKLESESDRSQNNYFLKSFYSESISALNENEAEKNECISGIVSKLKSLNLTPFSKTIINQICESLQNFKLNKEYKTFNGLFFEFDSSPNFSGIAFKEPKFEVILESPKYIDFEDGSYACDYSIDFEVEELFRNILSEEFEEIAWEFEFELDIFQKIKDTAYNIVAINLHKALNSIELITKLNDLGFEKEGVVYLNEHDMEVKTVYVNE